MTRWGWTRVAAALMTAGLLATAGLVVAAGPAAARDLAVPAGKGWKHTRTGVILLPMLAGLPRTALSARYEAADGSVIASLFLFHPARGDVALWFDRSRTALETNEAMRGMSPATAAPVAFAAPGATTSSSLKQVYARPDGGYRSSALAVVPVGAWLVAIRLTAARLSAGEIDARLSQLIAAVRWPAPGGGAAARAAVPVAACAVPLTFAKAKPVKPAMGDMLPGLALLGNAVAAAKPAGAANAGAGEADAAVTWCREDAGSARYGVYRASGGGEGGGGASGYTMALGDAGRVVSVAPSLMAQIEHKGDYAVTLTDVDSTVSTFSSFNRLPAPEQVWSLVAGGRPSSRVQGGQVTLDSGAL